MSITIFGTCRNDIEEVENNILYINNLLKDKKILYITHFCHDKIKYLNSEVYYKRKKYAII